MSNGFMIFLNVWGLILFGAFFVLLCWRIPRRLRYRIPIKEPILALVAGSMMGVFIFNLIELL